MSTKPLEAAGIAGEVFAEYEEKTGGENTREYLTEDGPCMGISASTVESTIFGWTRIEHVIYF